METEILENLSFAEATTQGIDQWAANLPLVNTEATGHQLVLACDEITRLDAEANLRFELLDTLRPLVHYVCSRLERQAAPGVSASLLASALSDGYLACFQYCRLQDLDDKECRSILARSGHRLIAELGRLGLYCAQRYQELPENFWRITHEAYAFLADIELAETALKDTGDSAKPTTVTDMYLRNLLFASCKPNQLNAQDLLHTFNTLESWVEHASLEMPNGESIPVVNLDSNKGPGFHHKVTDAGNWRALNTEILCYEAEAFVNEVNTILVVPEFMQPRLITHLVQAWSTVQPRNFRRLANQGQVRLCMGIRAVHYFLSGAVDFSEQISNADAVLRREVNPFLDVDYEPVANTADDDPWSNAHDLKVRIPENPNIENPDAILSRQPLSAEPRKFEHYELLSLDTSPGGYRLEWQEAMPANVQVGDLVGIREERDNRWCVAVLRWISGQGEFGQMGLELLAPRAIPIAVRQIQKKGSAAGYSRGILLPGLEAIGQPATMLTPRLPFKAHQKVNIHRQGLQSTGLLQEQLLTTESFNQFSFRMLDGYLENPPQSRNIDALSAMTREDSTRGP